VIPRLGLALAFLLVASALSAQTLQPPVPMPPGLVLQPLRPPPQPAPAPAPAPSPAAPAQPASPSGWDARQTADLQALDKVDDRTANLAVPVNQSGRFGHLEISVRACVVRPPDQPADAAAYLDIVDPRPNAPGFHGWMLSNEPAASIFQHPVYDVRLTGCH